MSEERVCSTSPRGRFLMEPKTRNILVVVIVVVVVLAGHRTLLLQGETAHVRGDPADRPAGDPRLPRSPGDVLDARLGGRPAGLPGSRQLQRLECHELRRGPRSELDDLRRRSPLELLAPLRGPLLERGPVNAYVHVVPPVPEPAPRTGAPVHPGAELLLDEPDECLRAHLLLQPDPDPGGEHDPRDRPQQLGLREPHELGHHDDVPAEPVVPGAEQPHPPAQPRLRLPRPGPVHLPPRVALGPQLLRGRPRLGRRERRAAGRDAERVHVHEHDGDRPVRPHFLHAPAGRGATPSPPTRTTGGRPPPPRTR